MLYNIQFSKNNLLRETNLSKLNRRHNFNFNRIYLGLNYWMIFTSIFLHRKEVIHPHVPVGIPCFDLTPITSPTLDVSLPCGLR